MPLVGLSILKGALVHWKLVGIGFLALALGVQTLRVGSLKRDQIKDRATITAYIAAQKAAEAKAKQTAKDQAQISKAAQGSLDAQQGAIQGRTKTIIERIPTYVPAQAVAGCVIPRGFVELFNASAAGNDLPAVASAAGGPLQAPSGVGLDTVASVTVSDLGTANGYLAEVKTWRAWYLSQKAAMQ